MAVGFRGATSGAASASGTRSIALPTGTVAGDWAILAIASAGTGEVWTWGAGWTELLQDTFGTAKAGIAIRQITSGDVTAGTVSYSQAAVGSTRYAFVVYSGASGFGTLGAVTKRSSSTNTITAQAVSLTANQRAVVIRLEKATNNPGPSSASPTTTLRAESYSNASAAPSVWVGDTDTAGTRTFTDPVASGNGLGVQVPISPSSAPVGDPKVSVWDGATEVTGCTVSVWDGSTEITISPTALTLSP